MFKKAQGISVNVIIIAAIALIVLVVLVAIFTGRLGLFSTGLDQAGTSCEQACKSLGYKGQATQVTETNDYETTVIKEGEVVYCDCE